MQVLKVEKQLPLPKFLKQLGKELAQTHIQPRPEHRQAPRELAKSFLNRLVRGRVDDLHCLEPLLATASSFKPRGDCKVCRDSLPAVEGRN